MSRSNPTGHVWLDIILVVLSKTKNNSTLKFISFFIAGIFPGSLIFNIKWEVYSSNFLMPNPKAPSQQAKYMSENGNIIIYGLDTLCKGQVFPIRYSAIASKSATHKALLVEGNFDFDGNITSNCKKGQSFSGSFKDVGYINGNPILCEGIVLFTQPRIEENVLQEFQLRFIPKRNTSYCEQSAKLSFSRYGVLK